VSARPASRARCAPLALSFCQQLDGLNLEQASPSQAPPPEQPCYHGPEQLAGGALAVAERGRHERKEQTAGAEAPAVAVVLRSPNGPTPA
jgi:hypothetical protein